MNTNQFTQKTMEALQNAQSLAIEHQNQALEPEHLLAALASQENGFIPQLLKRMGVEPSAFAVAAQEKVEQLPHVSGTGRDPDKVYISQDTDKALNAAQKQAAAMKDEYVSVEHVFLGILEAPNRAAGDLFRAFSIDKNNFLNQLAALRGNQRVTSDHPEDTYDVLEKYGQELVILAKQN